MFSVYSTFQHDRGGHPPALPREPAADRASSRSPSRVALTPPPTRSFPRSLGERWSPAIGPLRAPRRLRARDGVPGAVERGVQGPRPPEVRPHRRARLLRDGVPSLFVFVPWLGIKGAPLALLIGLMLAGVPAFVARCGCWRSGSATWSEPSPRPSPPPLCGGCRPRRRPADVVVPPAVSLALVAAAGVAAYVGGSALFARKIVSAMWTNARSAA